MTYAQSMDQLSLTALFVITAGIFLIAVELGYHLGKSKHARWGGPQQSQVSSIMGACLALLAFFLAFAFNMANSRFDTRKQLVLEEANAIGTTYLRAKLLPEPHRTNFERLLREYVEVRAAVAAHKSDLRYIQEIIARSEEIHHRLWSHAVSLAEQNDASIVTGVFVESLNNVIDLHAKRVTAGLRNRTPMSIWVTLYSVGFLSMALIGYHAGLTGSRSFVANFVLILTFSAVLLLITDLERPGQKFFRVSQQAMMDLKGQIGPPAP